MSISRKFALSALLLTGLSVPCQSMSAGIDYSWSGLAEALYENRQYIPRELSRNWQNIALSAGALGTCIWAGYKLNKTGATEKDREQTALVFPALAVAGCGLSMYRAGWMPGIIDRLSRIPEGLNKMALSLTVLTANNILERPGMFAISASVVGLLCSAAIFAARNPEQHQRPNNAQANS